MATQTHEQPTNELARQRSADEFEVFDISDPTRPSSNGTFLSLDEARGCVEFDGLEFYEIWQGDHIVEGRDEVGIRGAEDDDSFPDSLTGGIDADV